MLLEYDRENTPREVLAKVKPYLDRPEFEPTTVERVSRAAKSLCIWVRAMVMYAEVSYAISSGLLLGFHNNNNKKGQ